MGKLLAFTLFTVLQLTNCSPVKRNWVNEVKKEPIILDDTNPEYRGGPDIVEGDIKLTPVQAAIFRESGWDGLVKSEAWAINPLRQKWPRFIPYVIDSDVGSKEKKDLQNAIKEIQKFTCLKFSKRINEKVYMKFVNKKGCYSRIGYVGKVLKTGGVQEVSVGKGCTGFRGGHEILHALGRFHEQSRPDRDDYVTIITKNIKENRTKNFVKKSKADTQGLPYDYLSVMHYEENAFKKSKGLLTIKPKQKGFIGQRRRLSMYDIQHINIRYCPERAVRLVGSKSKPSEGRVEVFWNGEWGTICDNGFNQKNGEVICKYLGFPGIDKIYKTATLYGPGTGPIWFDFMKCYGKEESPFSCKMRPIGESRCYHSQDVAIKCQDKIRLAGSNFGSEGRVEIKVKENWGTICSESISYREVKVICRQLGLEGLMGSVGRIAEYGQGTGPIHISELKCTGQEQEINQCLVKPFEKGDCTHSQDVAIKCGSL